MPYTSGSAQHPFKIGLFLPTDERAIDGRAPRWSELVAMAQQAEALGLDSVWLPDHFIFRYADTGASGFWDGWSLLAALAAVTRRVELGTLVLCTGFRNPALLAKMADTVDEISGGRLILGLGAGYHEPEYTAFGYPYDHRASRFAEALTIIRTLLRDGQIDFDGRFHQARDCELRPRAGRPGGPPILVGTRGERMLRLTAQQADIWNVWLAFGRCLPDDVRPLCEQVDAACQAVGRDPATLERSVTLMIDPLGQQPIAFNRVRTDIAPEAISGPPAAIAAAILELVAEGITSFQVYLPSCTPAAIDALGPVLAEFERS